MSAAAPTKSLLRVPLAELLPDPRQPRTKPGSLADLIASIRANGLCQPITVTAITDPPSECPEARYQIVAGERRYRAAEAAGLLEVDIILTEPLLEADRLFQQVAENTGRADLPLLDRALAVRRLLDEHGLSQQEIANRLGKNKATVSRLAKISRAEGPLLDALEQGLVGNENVAASLVDAEPKTVARLVAKAQKAERPITTTDLEASASAPTKKKPKPEAPSEPAETSPDWSGGLFPRDRSTAPPADEDRPHRLDLAPEELVTLAEILNAGGVEYRRRAAAASLDFRSFLRTQSPDLLLDLIGAALEEKAAAHTPHT